MGLVRKCLWWFKQRFPRTGWALRWLIPARRAERRRNAGLSTQQIFQQIFDKNAWGMDESRSGAGSTLTATEHLRRELPRIVAMVGARTFLDAPCGDFNWMRHCELGVDHYTGADIVPALVERLRNQHASPTRSFIQLDITKDPLPHADIFLCRDCFIHLSFAHIHDVIDNFLRSDCKHLLVSTYRDMRGNVDNFTGGVRMLNLTLPPFGFPQPIEYIVDRGEAGFDRNLGLWSREQIANADRRRD